MEKTKRENKEKQKESKKELIQERTRKDRAIVRGKELPISMKHAIALCKFIKGKTINHALSDLEKIVKLRMAVPFAGEIPHRKGKGMASGRYPIKAAKHFIKLLKNLKANAIINSIENIENLKINAKADIGSRKRYSRKYRRFKRTNVLLEIREIKREKSK